MRLDISPQFHPKMTTKSFAIQNKYFRRNSKFSKKWSTGAETDKGFFNTIFFIGDF